VTRRLNDPELARAEYADESRFAARAAVWERTTGPDAQGVALDSVRAIGPRRILEVGPGRGELAERIRVEVGAVVVAVDQSERMVGLTRARGVDALVGDVQQLPFAVSFDCAVAAWKLYHVDDLDRGLAELARSASTASTRRTRGTVTFPDWEAARRYIGGSITRWELADELQRFEGPLFCPRHSVVFVAETAT